MNFVTFQTIHSGLARTAWMFMAIMGIWAFVLYLRNKPLDGNFFGIVAVGELLLAAQALIGLTSLIIFGVQPGRGIMHFLYGTLSVLVLPAIYYYTHGDESRRSVLIWALTGLFMFGLSLRAIGTGAIG